LIKIDQENKFRYELVPEVEITWEIYSRTYLSCYCQLLTFNYFSFQQLNFSNHIVVLKKTLSTSSGMLDA
jgi:hypothetical protein